MPVSSRPPGRPRTARERVAQRRSATAAHPRQHGYASRPSRRQGCGGRVVLGVLLLGAVGLFVAGLLLTRAFGTLQQFEQEDPRALQQEAASANGAAEGSLSAPFTALLLGVDLRPDPEEGARSDTLIVVRVDPQAGWAGMLSIPRDSIATIARTSGMRAKINYAYSYGYQNAAELYGPSTKPTEAGGALAAETVEDFLDTPIDYIAQVDFRGFEQIVDTLGGIVVDVPQPLLDAEYPTENYGVERIYIPAGLQRLDGTAALRYARSRHADSDFGRSKRQQQVLRALLDEVRRKGLLEQAAALPGLVDALKQTVSTTLPVSDPATLNGLVALARGLSSDRIMQLTINVDEVGLIAEDGSDLYWDEAGLRRQVARLLAGPADTPGAEAARIQVQNGAGVEGIAGRVSDILARQGFVLADAGDAGDIYPNTTIIDYRDNPQTRERLASALGVDAQFVTVDTGAAPPEGADIVVIVGADYRPEWIAGP